MKKNVLLSALLLLTIKLQAQELSKPKEIPVKGIFTNPVASPDGKHALLTQEHNHGVFLLNIHTQEVTPISTIGGIGYGYTWNLDSQTFYFKEKGEKEYFSNSRVKSYSIKDKIAKETDLNHNLLPSFNGKNEIVVHTNPFTLQIEATNLKTQKTWAVTNDEGQYYNAILSHDGKKVAVHKGADIWVYNVDGSDKGKLIGQGIATSWSTDDKYLIGFLDESLDGHSISNSEILLFDVENGKTKKLTSTEDQFEMFPSLFGENQIIFSDEKSGKIYVTTLKL
ncbi:TolB family protein [Flavobacterium terrae]|uniref:WD40-like Beta Propeller Repeat n=1 Tax=Flavobacterium terrae TaxID=415425 RepID=A0A1M6F4X7_9FLAO|nr:hypothetical protein [Flavobacterium terrae]SHI92757.1 hypothetical protein SAMN05444363_2138 [Flavobacterium terrae]